MFAEAVDLCLHSDCLGDKKMLVLPNSILWNHVLTQVLYGPHIDGDRHGKCSEITLGSNENEKENQAPERWCPSKATDCSGQGILFFFFSFLNCGLRYGS